MVDRRPRPGPEQQQHAETNATFENRGTTTDRLLTRRDAPTLLHRTISPISPPSQSEPVIRCSQSRITEIPRGEVCAACPALPGNSSTAAAASSAPVSETTSAIERRSRSGRSSHSAIQRGEAEQREAEHHVDVAAPERGRAEQRHERRQIEH